MKQMQVGKLMAVPCSEDSKRVYLYLNGSIPGLSFLSPVCRNSEWVVRPKMWQWDRRLNTALHPEAEAWSPPWKPPGQPVCLSAIRRSPLYPFPVPFSPIYCSSEDFIPLPFYPCLEMCVSCLNTSSSLLVHFSSDANQALGAPQSIITARCQQLY